MQAGKTVLDLGCGTGRDCFVCAQLVGETGSVIGVDMTEAQLAVARKHEEWHAARFGCAAGRVLGPRRPNAPAQLCEAQYALRQVND